MWTDCLHYGIFCPYIFPTCVLYNFPVFFLVPFCKVNQDKWFSQFPYPLKCNHSCQERKFKPVILRICTSFIPTGKAACHAIPHLKHIPFVIIYFCHWRALLHKTAIYFVLVKSKPYLKGVASNFLSLTTGGKGAFVAAGG